MSKKKVIVKVLMQFNKFQAHDDDKMMRQFIYKRDKF